MKLAKDFSTKGLDADLTCIIINISNMELIKGVSSMGRLSYS